MNAESKQVPVIVQIRDQITKQQQEFAAALPAHIPAAKFVRSVLTAIQMQPALLSVDRKSLMGACMKAANDGLILDGREAALVTFGSSVQYMPMVAGLLKKMRNSGEISSLSAHVVYEKDTFLYVLGDAEKVEHQPFMGGDRGKPVAAYAIARLRDGSVQREVMSVADIERIRSRSRAAKAGPWVSDWSEMARKTVIRRLSKYLPASTDRETGQSIMDIVSRDDAMFDHETAAPEPNAPGNDDRAAPKPRKPRGAGAAIIDQVAEEIQQEPVTEPVTVADSANADDAQDGDLI